MAPPRATPCGRYSMLAIEASLASYETVIDDLLLAIATPSTEKLDEVLDRVIKEDRKLSEALDEVHLHAQQAQRIRELQQTSNQLDEDMDAVLQELMTLNGSFKSHSSRQVKADYTTLLQFAGRIAKFTAPGKDPWPSEELMRRGWLASQGTNTAEEKPAEKEATALLDPTKSIYNSTIDLDLFAPDAEEEGEEEEEN